MLINSGLVWNRAGKFSPSPGVAGGAQDHVPGRLSPRSIELPAGPEETILLRILDKTPKHIDEIAREANMPVQRTVAVLLELELRGLVSQLPGKYFISEL
jgi:DNA processing protein